MAKLDTRRIKAIVFDADDTLWDCQSHFERVEKLLYNIIAPCCTDPAAELYETESRNMADLGYGCKAFTISVMETALRVRGNDLRPAELQELLEAGKSLLQLPATPLPGVVETLDVIARSEERFARSEGRRIVCFTKGELQDQENKLRRSGLMGYFDHVEITSDKTEREFRELSRHLGLRPDELLMVGNSLKSDIAPALAVGAQAVHIPFHVTWQLEEHAAISHPDMVEIARIDQLPALLYGGE